MLVVGELCYWWVKVLLGRHGVTGGGKVLVVESVHLCSLALEI